MKNPRLRCIVLLFWALLASPAQASETASLWQAIKSGDAVVLMRHALAPGVGDPPDFTPGDCNTQRNLNHAGREQAQAIGDRFRRAGIAAAEIASSEWCRCRDTAALLRLGRVQTQPLLNSFFGDDRQTAATQTAALNRWIVARGSRQPLVLVTHQVNITAITGDWIEPGEMAVMRITGEGELQLLGTL